MANKKRKTLQIKRPSASGRPTPKKKESAASDTTKFKAPDKKSSTTRIPLPDESKIRKARGSDASEDLKKEEKLPTADQIAQAANNETMAIEIDDDVQATESKLPDTTIPNDSDQTMQISAEDLEAADIDEELQRAGNTQNMSDQTLQINTEEIEADDSGDQLKGAGQKDQQNDQTLQIDTDEVEAADSGDELKAAGQEKDTADETMEIDTGDVETEHSADDLKAADTSGKEEIQSMETMKMDTMAFEDNVEEELKAEETAEETDQGVTKEEMVESFSAQTMAMDPDMLKKELEEADASKDTSANEKNDPNRTMDLSQKKSPKTVMVKRPSREDTSPNAPTVKASRPNAETLKAKRPVTATPGKAKESTSRVDIPEGEKSGGKDNKTIKLRRPSGGPKPSLASDASESGIQLDDDGITASSRKKPMGGAWVAVAVVAFIISLGAIWSIVAMTQTEVPMPGRLVDVNGQLIGR